MTNKPRLEPIDCSDGSPGSLPRMIRKPAVVRRLLTSSSSISDDSGSREEVETYGLMITIEEGRCSFRICSDQNYRNIHPNIYAPTDLNNVKALGGGGSGVAVFAGKHPELGDLVMKHGGFKDMGELFALATIAEELKRRGSSLGEQDAALDMQRRLPEFKMIYISPSHIMDRGKELWGPLKDMIKGWSVRGLPSMEDKPSSCRRERGNGMTLTPINGMNLWLGMSIRLFEGEEDLLSFELDTSSKKQSLAVILPQDSSDRTDKRTVRIRGDAYDSLNNVVDELVPLMTDRLFKFTLAQKTIGGESPKTGNQWLYEGKLKGPVLENLISQFIRVIHNLQALTLPEEVDAVALIRAEVERFDGDLLNVKAEEISDVADRFVGNAVKKNFHSKKGRNDFLHGMSLKFREGGLILTPEEIFPAHLLGNLLRPGALMSDTFVDAPMSPTVLQAHDHFWRNILHRAVDTRKGMSKSALKRIWTCGLADAGIHNLFVSEDDLFLFDLGEPQLQSLPGFLTKYLFSFFHTLGMQEDENNKDTWVRRFVPRGDKLVLTQDTIELLPHAYDAFQTSLDRVIDELLDGDRHMRWLLLEYVTLQLLSDAAFCLQRWEIKGGGQARDKNHNKGIEKWLWRAIWDVYIAFDINTQESWARFKVQNPHFRKSISPEDDRTSMRSLGSLAGASLIENLRLSSSRMSDSLRDYLLEEVSESSDPKL